jgi:hypothetical protein
VGSIFTDKEVENLEDHVPHSGGGEIPEKLQVDDYTQQRLKELGLFDDESKDDPYNLVSYK